MVVQIDEGELISCKAVIDNIVNQLQQHLYAHCNEDIQNKKEKLIKKAHDVQNKWKEERQKHVAKHRLHDMHEELRHS